MEHLMRKLRLRGPHKERTPTEEVQAGMEKALEKRVARNKGYGGGIVRIESTTGGVIATHATGTRTADSDVPISVDNSFEAASITKSITAAVVLLLVERGLFESLDTPVARYLPRGVAQGLLVLHGVDYSDVITLRQLLSHRSGIAHYWDDPPWTDAKERVNHFLADYLADTNRIWEPAEIVPYIRRLKPKGAPGSTYHYSDSNFVLLGLAIEAVTHAPLHKVYRDLVFTPLGMQHSYLRYRESPPASAPPLSHRYEGDDDMTTKHAQSANWAGGGVVSTAADLSKFIRAVMEGRLFARAESLRQMLQVHSHDAESTGIHYGLGVFVIDPARGGWQQLGQMVGHMGWGSAFMYYWVPVSDALANTRPVGVAITGTLNQCDCDFYPLLRAAVRELSAHNCFGGTC